MRYLITAGPSREPIDAVRFVSNRSSGRMGVALAVAACEAGHEVMLLIGKGATVGEAVVMSVIQRGAKVVSFDSCDDLAAALETHWPAHDVLVMAAAVADYRPAQTTDAKLPRDAEQTTLTLQRTPDLVAHVAAGKRANQRVIAFALEEPGHLTDRARDKMQRKGVDAIVANALETMDATDANVVWLPREGETETSEHRSKQEVAAWIVARIDAMRDRV